MIFSEMKYNKVLLYTDETQTSLSPYDTKNKRPKKKEVEKQVRIGWANTRALMQCFRYHNHKLVKEIRTLFFYFLCLRGPYLLVIQ